MKKTAVFPGSFDPVTRGHESILKRALPLFDEVIIAIGVNPGKKSFFPLERRIQWLEEVFRQEPRIRIVQYEGLTVDLCWKVGANYILRGLRSSADFEFEHTIGLMNKAINPGVESLFLLASQEYAAISSSIVREIFINGGDISSFIPESITIKG